MLREQRGSTTFDAVVGITLVMILSLGTIQVALTVYAHNAVKASAYDAARVAAEIGGSLDNARSVAEETLRSTAGGLIQRASVALTVERAQEGHVVRVAIVGRQRAIGPIPFSFPIRAEATSLLEQRPR